MPKITSDMPSRLNLPICALSLRRGDKGVEVKDVLRDKWIKVTPEEWVRQHFVNYLVNSLGYPVSRMANEMTLKLNGTSRRCDTVVFSHNLRPLMIIEYKSPAIKINQATLDQAARYNIVLDVPFLVLSNGMEHYCFRINRPQTEGEALRCTLCKIPTYAELIETE